MAALGWVSNIRSRPAVPRCLLSRRPSTYLSP